MINDFGFYMFLLLLCLYLMGIAGGLSSMITEANIAYECKTYSAATIDGKVYACALRGKI